LVQAKSSLSTTKPELRRLAGSSQRYDDMLQTLAHVYVSHRAMHRARMMSMDSQD
jgi:hypothetical protein